VFSATSSAAKWRQLVSVFLQPTLCIVAFVAFWISISSAFLAQILLFVVVAPIISCVAVYVLLNSIERLGKNVYSCLLYHFFKAFLLNWITDLNQPLEKYLEDMGKDTDIEGALLKFDSSKTKAAIILPLVHPGPFKNIGSSLLPSLLKHEFEKSSIVTHLCLWGFLVMNLILLLKHRMKKLSLRLYLQQIFRRQTF